MAQTYRFAPWRAICAALAACALVTACAFDPVLKEAREHFEGGRGEQALLVLDKAARADPANHAYRTEYFRQRELLVAQWLGQADVLRVGGQFEAAQALYKRVQTHDPQNPRARAGLAQIDTDRRHRTQVANAEKLLKAGKFHDALDALRPVLAENPEQREARRLQRLIEERTAKPAIATPRLKTAATKPILLELRDVTLGSVFDVIGRAGGINFVFDKDVRTDQRTSISVRNATIEELIKLVLASNQLEQKIVNETTVLVYPNTPQKRLEHQELVVKSFYLANADVRQTANMIRTLVKTRDIFIDEKLNLLVIKDTPSAIRIAEQLIAAQDLAEPEVMLEVEVLEIGYNRMLELGVNFPERINFGAPLGDGTPPLLAEISRGNLVAFAANPLLILNLKQQDGTTSVLANPRIRVKNKEKARIHIGDRVPVITTTAAATGGFVSESVSYLDVGLKLEVEPVIHLEDEVGIKVGLEVSNIVREVRGTTSGTLTYQIGTRNANTLLRLKDGETQILAGLISDEDRRSASRVPGLGELPVVGRLFSSTRDTAGKTEIVLLITPRLVRTLARPDARTIEFAAGTEASISGTGLSAPAVTPFGQKPPVRPAPPQQPTPSPFGQPPGRPATPAPLGWPGAVTPGAPSSPTAPTLVPFGGVQPAPSR
jgi:general secretion pathway protein D